MITEATKAADIVLAKRSRSSRFEFVQVNDAVIENSFSLAFFYNLLC